MVEMHDGSFMVSRYDDQGRTVAESQQVAAGVDLVWSASGSPDGTGSFINSADSSVIPNKLYTYDEQGRLTHVSLPAVDDASTPATDQVRPTYQYGYDANGNQTLIVDPKGHETRFTFSEEGQQLSRTLPLGFGADGMATVVQASSLPDIVDTLDFTEHFEYDDRGRQTLHISFEGDHTRSLYDSNRPSHIKTILPRRYRLRQWHGSSTRNVDLHLRCIRTRCLGTIG